MTSQAAAEGLHPVFAAWFSSASHCTRRTNCKPSGALKSNVPMLFLWTRDTLADRRSVAYLRDLRVHDVHRRDRRPFLPHAEEIW
jgi:hypothetical protein